MWIYNVIPVFFIAVFFIEYRFFKNFLKKVFSEKKVSPKENLRWKLVENDKIDNKKKKIFLYVLSPFTNFIYEIL